MLYDYKQRWTDESFTCERTMFVFEDRRMLFLIYDQARNEIS